MHIGHLRLAVGTRDLCFAALTLLLVAACGDDATGPNETPGLGAEPGANDVILYVTFSGESDKPGVTDPVDNIYGIKADGTYDDTKNRLDPGSITLDELRGMALSPDGSMLFVANANKHLNEILVFGPLTNEPRAMKYVSTYADPTTPDLVKSSDGGLKGPRGLVASSAFNRLWVADNADLSVKSYELDTGKYEGKVAEFNTGQPVGLAFDETQGWLFVTAETSDDVHRVDVGTASSPCDSDCSQDKIIDTHEGNAVLDAPSGIAIVPGPGANEITLYVASRKGLLINQYVYDASSGLQSSETFATGFTDTPEQLIAAR